MKKILISTAILTSIISTNIAFASDLQGINVLDNGNISVNTTSDLVLSNSEIEGDLKVLKDYVVSYAKKDTKDFSKISLNLTYPLEKNKIYSIIWVDWAEANMNFTISEKIEWEYENLQKTSAFHIKKINVLDSKTIEIFYSENVEAEEFVFRILSEIEVKEKKWNWQNTLNISLKTPLEDLTPYIILANSLVDINGKKVKLEESFYDFETKADLVNVFWELPKVEEEVKDDWNVVEVAEKMKKTPETWASAFFIILFAILFSTYVFSGIRKKV